MKEKEELVSIAIHQHGYFTASQAEAAGYSQKNHHYHVKNGDWIREARGLYRMAAVPLTDYSHYWQINLQFRNLNDEPQPVFSGATALEIYELSDVNPAKVHIYLPKKFRTQKQVPKSVEIEKSDINEGDFQVIEGLKVTTPIKTVLDLAQDESFPEEHLEQAVKEGLKKGYFLKSEIKASNILARYAL